MTLIHQGQPIVKTGKPLSEARAAMILLHGRGATADSILSLAYEFDAPEVTFLAPQAADYQWYPQRFIAPLEQNEPFLSSALLRVRELVEEVEAAGIPADKIILAGFSQGACLALEFAARNPRRYGGVAALSGGLIGPEGMTFSYPGSLAGTPVFLGCSDVDFHIPLARVKESTEVLRALGGEVTERIYPGMGHTVNRDELDFVQGMINGV